MEFKVGGKIGYLNTRTGRYFWAKIVEINGTLLTMKEVVRTGRGHIDIRHFVEVDWIVKNHLETPSCDFTDGRPLMKYKGCR